MSCDMPECSTTKERKARKEHRCLECNGVIKKGERYKFESGVWDGQGRSFKTCMDCIHMRCETSYDDCGFCFGGLIDAIKQCDNEGELISAFNAYSEVRGGVKIEMRERA